MDLIYKQAQIEDIECIYHLSKNLIDQYEDIQHIDYEKVINWIYKKIEKNLSEYTCIYQNNKKVGYVHFSKDSKGMYEIDDLYIFDEYQNRGIGTQVIKRCIEEADSDVYLYVFIKNERAVDLYERIGFVIVENVKDSRYIMSYKRKKEKHEN